MAENLHYRELLQIFNEYQVEYLMQIFQEKQRLLVKRLPDFFRSLVVRSIEVRGGADSHRTERVEVFPAPLFFVALCRWATSS